MKYSLNSQMSVNWKTEDFILLFIILLQDAGTFEILPLNISQILFIILGLYLIWLQICLQKQIKANKKLVYLLIYVTLITLLNRFDIDSIKSLAYLSIQIIITYWYLKQKENYYNILQILYLSAFLLSLYGIIQEISFILDLPKIYDLSLYGFSLNGTYISSNNMLRVMSFYSEPAHLSGILGCGFCIGIIGVEQKWKYTSKIKTALIILCSLLTQSVVVYISILLFFFYYLFYFQKDIIKKANCILLLLTIIICVMILKFDFLYTALLKLKTLINPNPTSSNDLSGFALISNIKIAIEKMKSGYWFGTGLDSHRIYYYQYIDKLYSSVKIYLNSNEAASLFSRIFSEFGIIGIVIIIAWLFNCFFNHNQKLKFFKSFFATAIIIQGLRNGHYTNIVLILSFVVLISCDNYHE